MVFYSLLTSLCPLIPIPFLDDWARDFLRRRLIFELAGGYGQVLDKEQTELLALVERQPLTRGCLRGCLAFTFLKPALYFLLKIAQKVYRKILIFLTIKDCVDTFSQTFHDAYLITHAFETGVLRGTDPPYLQTRRAIEGVKAVADPRPVENIVRQSLHGSRRLLARAAGRLSTLMRAERRREASGEGDPSLQDPLLIDEEEQLLQGLVARLSQRLSRQEGYLRGLERHLERELVQQNRPNFSPQQEPDREERSST